MARKKKTRKPKTRSAGKYVYFFGDGKADGRGGMNDLLGGKGAGLAEMTNAGLPVPPGFTLSTSACRHFFENANRVSAQIEKQVEQALEHLERISGQRLGSKESPLLVSVRSGAKFSMPGMMDTILNLGLNDQTVEALVRRTNNANFARDCYRRFIQMFGNVVLEIKKEEFDSNFEAVKKETGAKLDTDLTAEALAEIIRHYKDLVRKRTGKPFPQEPRQQLHMARDAVFCSWNNPRARSYRRLHKISETLGTAVNVQMMVFGNLGEDSGTGVGFTRNPSTGAKEFYGEFLPNAQGEDVVAGIRTPLPIAKLEQLMPSIYKKLKRIARRLERHYCDVQKIDFVVERGTLWLLMTRVAPRAARASLRFAVDFLDENLISEREAIFRVNPDQLGQLLAPKLPGGTDTRAIVHGLSGSPGIASGIAVFDAHTAERLGGAGANVILIQRAIMPDDVGGIVQAQGLITGSGMTGHGAVMLTCPRGLYHLQC